MSQPKFQTASTKALPVTSGPAGIAKHVISVSEKQRGNPLLKYIRNVNWEFNKEIIPDYVMGSTCAIFLSIKYHSLHSKHAELRIRELGRNFRLRILLVLVDVDDDISVKPLHELNKLCFTSDVTLLLCWSNEECARYLEIFKLYENKPASSIQEKVRNISCKLPLSPDGQCCTHVITIVL
jgi:DNA excision repair protein ERCC-1